VALPAWGGELPACNDDPPKEGASSRRDRVCARFPEFGFYWVTAPAARDDDRGDGERCAGERFHHPWGRHLRDLQR
jgi:hypothetical protein